MSPLKTVTFRFYLLLTVSIIAGSNERHHRGPINNLDNMALAIGISSLSHFAL